MIRPTRSSRSGADVIVSINASPYNKGKIKLRCDMVAHRAKLQKKPIVFVNLVGGNDGIIFDGASLIADEEGDIILQATAFEEFVETVELDRSQARCPRYYRMRVRGDPSGAGARNTRLRAQERLSKGCARLIRRHRLGSRRRSRVPRRSAPKMCFA